MKWRFSNGRLSVQDDTPMAVWRWRSHIARLFALGLRVSAGAQVKSHGAAVWQVQFGPGRQLWLCGRFTAGEYRDYASEGEEWLLALLNASRDESAIAEGRIVDCFATPYFVEKLTVGNGRGKPVQVWWDSAIAGRITSAGIPLSKLRENWWEGTGRAMYSVRCGCIVYRRRPLPPPAGFAVTAGMALRRAIGWPETAWEWVGRVTRRQGRGRAARPPKNESL